VLGGILYGLENDCPLPLPLDDDHATSSEPLTHDWTTAVEYFAESNFIADIFGEEYRHIYAAVRRDEISELASIITSVEYRYYLSRL